MHRSIEVTKPVIRHYNKTAFLDVDDLLAEHKDWEHTLFDAKWSTPRSDEMKKVAEKEPLHLLFTKEEEEHIHMSKKGDLEAFMALCNTKLEELISFITSEDIHTKKAGLRQLKAYMALCSSGLDETGFKKLWGALFRGMWDIDELNPQDHTAARYAIGMMQKDPAENFTPKVSIAYWNAYMGTMKDKWDTVDRYRLDRYFNLASFMLRSLIQRILHDKRGHETFVHLFTDIFEKEGIPDQLRLHLIGSFIPEFSKALGFFRNNNVYITEFGLKVVFIQTQLQKTSEKCCNFIKTRIRDEIIDRFDHLFQKSFLFEEREIEENEQTYYTEMQGEDTWDEGEEKTEELNEDTDSKRKAIHEGGTDQEKLTKKQKPNEED